MPVPVHFTFYLRLHSVGSSILYLKKPSSHLLPRLSLKFKTLAFKLWHHSWPFFDNSMLLESNWDHSMSLTLRFLHNKPEKYSMRRNMVWWTQNLNRRVLRGHIWMVYSNFCIEICWPKAKRTAWRLQSFYFDYTLLLQACKATSSSKSVHLRLLFALLPYCFSFWLFDLSQSGHKRWKAQIQCSTSSHFFEEDSIISSSLGFI